MAPEINNLLYIFFAAISDLEGLLSSLLGWLDPPTFGLTAERASRLRHKSSITCVGWFFMHHSSFVLWEKFISESLKLIKHSQKARKHVSVDFLCIIRALFYEKSLFLRAWNLLSIHKNSENNWRFQRSSSVSKKINRRNDTSSHKGLEPLTVGLKVQRSTDWASRTQRFS